MNRFIEDLRVKVEIKKGMRSVTLVAYIATILDSNVWIVAIFRLSSFFSKIRFYPLAKIFWLINRILFSVDIDPRADLAGGLILIHGIGIVIGHEVKSLGELKIYQGVTIGGNSGKRKDLNGKLRGQPLIEENVTLGIDSKILGPVKIGKNAQIGTNAIVTKDVSKNTVIIGNNTILRKIDENNSDI